ncbi:tripeptide aminopeptidase [Hathewaya proteolytica DSM 3090]|uniref:Peptidase T n=1 Tax=Hathewaya proteolytica DSM 3090 TaxID=1121331 RepID=A0A1M6RPJ7_9CLOT|nr:peptidase T [Hathewaya proteolytica]SHK34247.1 tripeptide aminopeptidase [Hathewaya proteolytica DSM 3090]
MSKVVERFLKYVSFDTQSAEDTGKYPSTDKQLVLAKYLVDELKELGLQNVELDKYGYVTGEIPANIDKKVPVVAFISHMDTSPEVSGANVKPQIVKNYDGKDIILNKEQNIVLSTEIYSDIKQFVGEDIITTDGTTLLGADDKAGIAEIVTGIEYLLSHPEIKHGVVKVAFTPDEEVGAGTDYFDVKKFGADFAFTFDGSEPGEFVYETFNAAGATVTIKGNNVHTGSAKGKMVNAIFIAQEFISLLPENERPENTEGYEGFYHVDAISGDVSEIKIQYLIRDFDRKSFEQRKQFIKSLENKVNEKYGEGTVTVEVKDQYSNMREVIEKYPHIIEIGKEAIKAVGLELKVQPIRGGTDGARLSFEGLPTPNIFAGGMNFHSKYEYVAISALEKATEVVVKIAELVAEK